MPISAALAGLISAGIGLAGSAGSSILGSRFNRKEAEAARDWQESMYNQYQSPSAMVDQYKEAGLNPALMYGSAGSGSIPSGPSASAVPMESTAGIMQAALALARSKAEIKNIEADTRQKEATAVGQETSNQFLADKLLQELERGSIDISAVRTSIEQMNQSIENMKTDRDAVIKGMELTDYEIDRILAEIDKTEKEAAILELEKDNVKITKEVLASQIVLNYAQAQNSNAAAQLTRTESSSLESGNKAGSIRDWLKKRGEAFKSSQIYKNMKDDFFNNFNDFKK